MVALTRFASSRGFVLETDRPQEPNLLTLYVPAVDPGADRIPSLSDALHQSTSAGDKSFFLQLLKIGKDSDTLAREIESAMDFVNGNNGKHAFVLWNNVPTILFKRSADWKQTAGSTILKHLATCRINLYSGNSITVAASSEPSLVFKEVKVRLAANHVVLSDDQSRTGSVDILLDLRRGVFRFEGISKIELFADQVFSQALFRGNSVEGNTGSSNFGLRSSRDITQVFHRKNIRAMQNEVPDLGFLVRGELDLFPYDKLSWNLPYSSREIQKRSRIELIKPVGTQKSHINLPVNQHDTIGNIIHLQVGKPGQTLRFVRAPQQLFHSRENLDLAVPSSGPDGTGSLMMPEGVFPIAPLFEDKTATVSAQARRLKLGVSNTEVVKVEEKGAPAAALLFLSEATDGNVSITSENEQPGFIRRSILDFSRDLELDSEEIEDFKTGELLSTSVTTIWAHVVPITADGQLISQARAATEQGWRVSSQADELVQFTPSQNLSLASASKTLDYQLDDEPEVALAARKMLFVSGAESGTSSLNTIEAPRIEDPLVLQNETLARYRLQQRTQMTMQIAHLRGTQGISVTPQGFELDRTSNNEVLSLAKSKNANQETKKFSIKFKEPGFRNLMRQNQFFLVVPAKYADISPGSSQTQLFDLEESIQISDWGFTLDLPSEARTVSLGATYVSRDPILIAKYKRGTLRNLLKNTETWDNYSQENRFPSDKVQSTEATIKQWIKEIDDSSPQLGRNDSQDKVDYYRYIRRILDNPDWVGTLVIYPQVDLDNIPEGLAGLASGMELERFRAHHIGFSQNKIEQANGHPSIEPSSFFGLVDYNDDTHPEKDFSFKVHQLKVLFGNSEVKGFDCLLKVKLAIWFGEDSTLNNGGAVPKGEPQTSNKTLWIRGRYESLITEAGQKINKYSFIHDRPIYLIKRLDNEYEINDGKFYQELVISYLEFRTLKSELGNDGKREVSSKIIIDAEAKFKKLSLPGISDIVNFESIEMNGLSLDFSGLFEKINGTWRALEPSNFWPDDLNFEGIAIDASFSKLRSSGLFANFPLKFEKFHLFKGLSLPEIGFSNFGGDKGDQIKFGLQFKLDIGSLGRLIGFDSSLVADLLVGWNPGSVPGFAVGLRFPDNGGRRLDLSMGPVKFTAGFFDMFEGDDGNNRFIALTDFRMDINGFKLPPNNFKSGILLTPAPDHGSSGEKKRSYFESMGWLAGFSAEKVAFLDKLTLFVSQNYKYDGPVDSAKQVVSNIEEVITLNLGDDKKKWEEKSREYRRKIDGYLTYNPDYEWFIGAGAIFADSLVEGYAVYNPPGLYGGEGSLKNFLSLSIMYQQTTPRLGVYTATLKFAEKIRRFSVGAVTIQLPWVVMKMDTDGGYLLNVGLNLSDLTDYRNAAAAEFGIFTGSAGVAYGRISGSALRDVPLLRKEKSGAQTALPVYTPVTRLTLSGKFGIGRSLDEWPMFSGGVHVSVYGILSGTWGKFSSIELKGQIDEGKIETIRNALPSHYHKYWAEIGILAEIWGVIDFAVTRFGVNARALIGYGVSFETLRGTTAYARALVSVSIRWVLFRIKVFGKKIEVAIPLNFSQEFRNNYVLARPKTGVSYDDYFITASGINSLRALGAFNLEDLIPAAQLTFHLDQAPPTSQQKPIEVLPLFDYVRNDTGNVVAVPVLNLLYASESDTGHFYDLLEFVINWSFSALKIDDLLSEGRLSKAIVRSCAVAVSALRLRDNRGEWSADRAKAHLQAAFRIEYIDPNTLPDQFEDEPQMGATVFFTPHEMTAYSIAVDGTETEIDGFANKIVPGTFIERLDQLFERRRIQVQEDDETTNIHGSLVDGTPQALEDYLFEEYLESILRAVWAILVEKLPEFEIPAGVTPAELKREMLKDAIVVSMRVNRQFFSGNRIPVDAMDPDGRNFNDPALPTLPLPSARSIEIDIDPDALPQGLVLFLDKSRIVFETDANAADNIRSLLNSRINFGRVTAGRKSPFLKGPKEGLPLTEEMPVNLLQGDDLRLHILPESLKPNTDYRLDRFRDGVHENATSNNSIQFKQVVLVRVPLLPVKGATDLYQIDRMPEDSRRILGLMRGEIHFGNPSVGFSFLLNVGESKEALDEISLDLRQSFILRTNLSRDPNPTEVSLSSLDLQRVQVRASFQLNEREKALSILRDAAETNSGGYMLRLKGFEEPDPQQLTIMIVLPEQRQVSPLPLYVQALVADASEENISNEAPFILREVGEKIIALGTPGVLELEVKRSNPENLFPSLNVPGHHVSRSEAVRERLLNSGGALEVLNNLTTFERFQYSKAAEGLLEASVFEEVNLSARYNLLAVSIEENQHYKGCPADRDLPVTPLEDHESAGQVKDWTYSWSVSASRLVKATYARSRDLILDDDYHFMYGAIGTDMNVTTQFRDIMGYKAPSGEKTATLKARYYDPLIPPGALEGMKSSHDVVDKKFVYTLSFDGAQLDSQNSGEISLSSDEMEENLTSRAAAIMRCMQQVRDKGTNYNLFSTLGFRGGNTKQLTNSDRREIYSFLKTCYDAVRNRRSDFTNSLALEFPLTGKAPDEGYALYRAELVISREENDVHESLLEDAEIAHLKNEVIEKRVELPLADEPNDSDRSKEERLADSLRAFTSRSKSGTHEKIIAAYSENARGNTLIYILDAKILELTPMRPTTSEAAAYAAFEPLATQAKSEVGAAFWNWAQHERAPQPSDQFERVTISNFDMDTAFGGLLHEIDYYNAPDQLAPFIGNSEIAELIERLAISRASLADCLALLHAPIYNSQADREEITKARTILSENLSNSLKRRVSRFYGLDTILVVPLAYDSLQIEDDHILLYGSVTQYINNGADNGTDGDQENNEGSFLPAAFRRNGDSGSLCIQFDVANAGASRLVKSPLNYIIEYVRVNLGTGDVGTIDPDNTRWLKLFEPQIVELAPKNKPANIPVLFKSLVKTPVVSVQESPGQDSELDNNNFKSWTLIVDVERKDQVAQDDTYLTIDYNTRPLETGAPRIAAQRSLLSVLYEYNTLAGVRGNGSESSTTVDDTLWLVALVYWAETLTSIFSESDTSSDLESVNLEKVQQHYKLSTENDLDSAGTSDYSSTTLLTKIGNWDSDNFTFKLQRVNPDKSIYPGTSDNLGGGLARVRSEYDPELRYQGNRITISHLNLMLLENAWPEVWVQRNQNLSGVDELQTNSKFLYASSRVRSGDRYTPSIRVEFGEITGATFRDALFDFMRNMVFDELFSQSLDADSDVWPTIDLMWSYESGVLDDLKIKHQELGLFQPEPIARSSAIQTGPDLMPIVEAVDASVSAWLLKNPQAKNRGRIELRMTIFSRLLETQKQLLRIEKIQFRL